MSNISTWTEIGIIVAVVLGGAIIGFITYVLPLFTKFRLFCVFRKKRQEHLLRSSIKAHSRIHEELTSLRNRTHACRTYIAKFHNGGNFSDGSSIKRFSITHESHTLSVLPASSRWSQSALVSLFPDLLSHLLTDTASLLITKDIPESYWKSINEYFEVPVFCCIPLYATTRMEVIGFLSVEWCQTEGPMDVEDVLSWMKSARAIIETEIHIQGE